MDSEAKPTDLDLRRKDYNYVEVVIPEDTNPKEYTFLQRRAEMLQMAQDKGDFSSLPVMKLAERYGVAHSQIVQDKRVLILYSGNKVYQRHSLFSEAVMTLKWASRKAKEAEDYKTAAHIAERTIELLGDLGAIDFKKPPGVVTDTRAANMQNVLTADDFRRYYEEDRMKIIINVPKKSE